VVEEQETTGAASTLDEMIPKEELDAPTLDDHSAGEADHIIVHWSLVRTIPIKPQGSYKSH
jgi:hypothetical protein